MEDHAEVSFLLAETKPGGFWLRFGAVLIDFVILVSISLVLLFKPNLGFFYVIAGLTLVYKPAMEMIYGGTVGKLLLGLRVIDEDGKRIGLITTLLRSSILSIASIASYLFQYHQIKAEVRVFDIEKMRQLTLDYAGLLQIGNVLSLVFLVSCLAAAFNHRKRGFHDYLAGTYVIEKE